MGGVRLVREPKRSCYSSISPQRLGRRGDISPVDFAVYPATPRAKPRLSQPFSVLFNFEQSQIWHRCKLLRELPVERRMPSG